MNSNITSLKIVLCMLICFVSGVVVLGILSNAAHSGGIAELAFALVVVVLAVLVCWGALAMKTKEANPNETLTPETGPWGQKPSPQTHRPARDINARMGLTAVVIIIAVIAGIGWVALAMFGTPEMLYSGWSLIGFVTLIAISVIWLSGPK